MEPLVVVRIVRYLVIVDVLACASNTADLFKPSKVDMGWRLSLGLLSVRDPSEVLLKFLINITWLHRFHALPLSLSFKDSHKVLR